MNKTLAEDLLYDLSTEGKQLDSEKIRKFGDDHLLLISIPGMDIPPSVLYRLNGW